MDSKRRDTTQKQLVHKPGPGPTHSSGGQKSSGRHCSRRGPGHCPPRSFSTWLTGSQGWAQGKKAMRSTRSSLPAWMYLPGKFSRRQLCYINHKIWGLYYDCCDWFQIQCPSGQGLLLLCQNDHLYKVLRKQYSLSHKQYPNPTPQKREREEKGKRNLMLLSKGMWATDVQPNRKLPGTYTNNLFRATHACYTAWYSSFGRAVGRQGGAGGLSLLSKPWHTHEESCG